MVESTIDKIKDITVERQIRKLAGVIDEQNQKIEAYGDATTDIDNLKVSDANQNTDINKLKTTSSTNTTDINNLKESDANQTTQINNLKQSVATDKLATESAITALQNKDTEQDGTLTNHATLIQGITESLVSAVQIMSGTTTGDIKVRLERESAAAIDSNDYNLGLPVSAEIIQGTGPSMFKIQITMSTGVKVVSNDFVFTTEAIGNDVYISSFTFKAGSQTGYLSADIGLNNGMTIEANNFLVPTDPNVTSAIADLQTRLTTVENAGVTDINTLKTTVSEHTSEINTLKSDVAGLTTDKADVNNSEQSIIVGTINATNINKNGVAVATVNDIPEVPDISGKVNIAQGVENAGKVLGINASGNVEPTEISSGGGSKTLYTGTLASLINIEYKAHTVYMHVPETFSIMYVYGNSYASAMVEIVAGTYTSFGGFGGAIKLGYTKIGDNECYIDETTVYIGNAQVSKSSSTDEYNLDGSAYFLFK